MGFMDSNEWKEMYLLAKAYYEVYDSIDIPVKFRTEKIKRLSKWLEDQKESYKKGMLNEEKIEALESLQINWEDNVSNSHENRWNRKYNIAKKYYEIHGNLNIPVNYITEKEGIKLGIWISTQRTNYKKHKLSKERIDALESIGMKWSLVHTRRLKQKQWNKMYELVLEYYHKYNNIDIPIKYEEEGIKLGKWLAKQQTNYRNGKLGKERIDALESVGIKWEKKSIFNDKEWQFMYAKALEYYEEHGNLNIPQLYKTKEGLRLGRWICTQRKNYKKHLLSEERIQALENIEIKWDALDDRGQKPNEDKWDKKYLKALEYYDAYGDLNIPIKYVTDDDIKLGIWINNQRKSYQKNVLSQRRIEKLESIGMFWESPNKRGFQTNEENWQFMYSKALEYYEEYGNLKILQIYETNDGIKLGRWIINQRQAYKNNKLSKERIEALERIGMIWSVRNKTTKDNIKNICIKYNIDYDANKDALEHVSVNELLAKIHYLSINNMAIMVNGCLNEIFRMSNFNLKIVYGCSLEEMMEIYASDLLKSVNSKLKSAKRILSK